jgi:putative nucleotidyltransferase with HDIG domain
MKAILKQKEVINSLGIWAIAVLWYFVFGFELFHNADLALGDLIASHSFWLFSPTPKEKDEVVIVAIDEKTRHRLNRKWPWPRSLTAQMIHRISDCDPKVIGLDIVISGESDPTEDNALIAALDCHPRIFSAITLQPDGAVQTPFQNFSKPTGFVNKPLDAGKVRSMIPAMKDFGGTDLLSMELRILQAYKGIDPNTPFDLSENEISFGKQMKIKLKEGLIPLNYLVHHNTFRIIPAYQVIENQINPNDFKDKIVMVGATDPVLHDEYDTVLGISPGVAIIANALVMLLSGRFITGVPLYPTLLFGLICSGIIYAICRRFGPVVSSLTMLAMTAGMFFFCVYLRSHDVLFSYFGLFFMPLTAFLGFNLYHYSCLIRIRNKIRNKALFDPESGLFSTRYFKVLVKEKSEQAGALALAGVKITNYEDLRRQFSVEEIKGLIKQVAAELRSELSVAKGDAMASLSPDVIGVVKENPKIDNLCQKIGNFVTNGERKEWQLDGSVARLSLKGLLLQKAAGERIQHCDPVTQMEQNFQKFDGPHRTYSGTLNEGGEDKNESKVDLRNVYDFILYDWEEKAKDLKDSLRALSETNSRLERLNIGIIKTLALSIDAKSAWTAGHSERVTRIAGQIGKTIGIDYAEQRRIQVGALLHDIGKLGIPADILDKPGKLTDEEYRVICGHPGKGAQILEPLEHLSEVISLVWQHHERFDGKGYPRGLRGMEIDFGARIIAVADVFDAVTSDRPYRAGMPFEKAYTIIEDGSGTFFDPIVVAAFIELFEGGSKKVPDVLFEPEHSWSSLQLCMK